MMALQAGGLPAGAPTDRDPRTGPEGTTNFSVACMHRTNDGSMLTSQQVPARSFAPIVRRDLGQALKLVHLNSCKEVAVDTDPSQADALLRPAEVAALLYVDPKTVTRWAIAGKINSIRTPGGHRRFLRSEVLALMTAGNQVYNPAQQLWSGQAATASTAAPEELGMAPQARGDAAAQGRDELAAAAAAVVAEAVAIALEAQAEEAAEAVIVTARAVAAAAYKAAVAADTARETRAAAAAVAAATVASSTAQAAATMQLQADASAVMLSGAASRAAEIVARTSRSGGDRDAVFTALRVAATAKAAAVAAAQEAALAAASVASAAAAAAAEVAFTVSAASRAFESEVATAAAKVQATATATAREVAGRTDARASGTALVAREAAAAVRALGEVWEGVAAPPDVTTSGGWMGRPFPQARVGDE
jgi:excisionase family DNA binding protein